MLLYTIWNTRTESIELISVSQQCVIVFWKKSLKWSRKLFWKVQFFVPSILIFFFNQKWSRGTPAYSSAICINLLVYTYLVGQLRRGFWQKWSRISSSHCSFIESPLSGKLHIMLTGIKKDHKVWSQLIKSDERHETIYHCYICPKMPRMHIGDCFINTTQSTNAERGD